MSFKLPLSFKFTMSFHTPWKTLLLILVPSLLILADDPNTISFLQFQEGDSSAGSGIVLSGESGGDLLASSWAPDESENLHLTSSQAEGVTCAGSPPQNQDQQPSKGSKRSKIRRSDHRKRDGAGDPPDFCRSDALWQTRSGGTGQQVDGGQKITSGTGTESKAFPLPDSAAFKVRKYRSVYVCHLVSAGSLQASSPVTWLEPCRRCKFTRASFTRGRYRINLSSRLIELGYIGSDTGSCTAQEDLWLCTYLLPRTADGNPNVSNKGPRESSLAKSLPIYSRMTCSNLCIDTSWRRIHSWDMDVTIDLPSQNSRFVNLWAH